MIPSFSLPSLPLFLLPSSVPSFLSSILRCWGLNAESPSWWASTVPLSHIPSPLLYFFKVRGGANQESHSGEGQRAVSKRNMQTKACKCERLSCQEIMSCSVSLEHGMHSFEAWKVSAEHNKTSLGSPASGSEVWTFSKDCHISKCQPRSHQLEWTRGHRDLLSSSLAVVTCYKLLLKLWKCWL